MPLLSGHAFSLLSVALLPIVFTFMYANVATHPLWADILSKWRPATGKQAFCLPPGPLAPPPKVNATTTKLEVPQSILINPAWDADTSYSIKASIGDVTIFEHEHSAPGREVGQSLLDTILRIGSVTKTFTILAILLSADRVRLTDSITKFVPGLNKDAYEDVTLSALASHTSGLGRYAFVGDLAVLPSFRPTALGLPDADSTDGKVPTCDPFPGGRICTREELLAGLNNPVYQPRSPHSGPLYSNVGYTLLGMVLEAVHNKSSEQVIHDLILEPLGLGNTFFSVPVDTSRALLPRSAADGGWFVPDFGNYNPSGGLWSTPTDIHRFLQSILSHDLLSKRETRRWLQPRAFLPSLHQAVGESWEILRPTDLGVKTPRPIDIFTKTGGVTGYAAYTAIVPEYNIALTINAAGGQANNVVSGIFPLMTKRLVAFADKLAQEQLAVKYAGTYKSIATETTNELILTVDDGPGLAISAWTMNGVSVLRTLAAMQKIPYDSLSARLYPSDLDSLGSENETWRVLLDRNDRSKEFAELQCASWNWGDAFRYATEPLDTVVFTKDAHGIVNVELLGWRIRLNRFS